MDTSEKITARMDALNIKGVDITKKIGASSGAISQWKKGVSVPSGKYLLPLAKMLESDPEWLLSGNGEPDEDTRHNVSEPEAQYSHQSIHLTDNEIAFVEVYRQLSQRGREVVFRDARTILRYEQDEHPGAIEHKEVQQGGDRRGKKRPA